jgi:hypothetical protein
MADRAPTFPSGHIHPVSGALRIVAALGLLGAAGLAGWLARPLLAIAMLGLVFSANFIVGRTTTWRARTGMPSPRPRAIALAFELALTFAIQTMLVGGLYLVGAGLAAVFGRGWNLQPISPLIDVLAPIALGLICAAMGAAAAWVERAGAGDSSHGAAFRAHDALAEGATMDEIRVLPSALTAQTFFDGIHYSHGHMADGSFDGTPNAASIGSDEKIRIAETRLGIALPEALRALYRAQNGGSVSALCIAKPGIVSPRSYDEILNPFGGYSDLYPTEMLITAWDSFLSFADPDDIETYGHLFTGGTEQMIVLAQWYRQSLVLDYSTIDTPRVGMIDFDIERWADQALWWPDFETFFAQLRRYEIVYSSKEPLNNSEVPR